jgi:hypothetical protein
MLIYPSVHKAGIGLLLQFLLLGTINAQTRLVPIGPGWAQNTVNTTVFRHNSVVSHQDIQYAAYYDRDGQVILAKRTLGSSEWEIRKTNYRGNVKDAHNGISIMVDGEGYLHMSWDHHGHPLRYCRSVTPGSLELTGMLSMTGRQEEKVTYPEFYRLSDGNLLFLYRDGSSGNGNLMMNFYNLKTRTWTQRQNAFINGEGARNAYWQMCVDSRGMLHLSWVWRESGDVATNHDMAYAKSADGGRSWQKSTGEAYELPITAANAEYAARIPQNHELSNTTSMYADAQGRPYIAAYFRPPGEQVPQYHLIYRDGKAWITSQISRRTTPFTLSGGGTKRIPISRPQIVVRPDGTARRAYLLFRDSERGSRVSVGICKDLQKESWSFMDLTKFSVGMWEPSFDTELWKKKHLMHIFIQMTGQGDGERTENIPPQMVSVLEWNPNEEL